MTDTDGSSRRQMLTRTALGVGAVAAVAATTSACTGGSSNTGSGVTQNAGNVNDLQDQEQTLTILPYNRIKTDPDQAYPSTLLTSSLEMQNQREKLLRFNDASKLGWAYLFTPMGALITVLPVKGKVSSTQSSMTTATGVYLDQGTGGGGNVTVPVPGDDLSFGPNEGGDSGKFFFTPDDVYVFWDGPVLYLDAPLNVLQQPQVVAYNSGSKPSNTATTAKR
jgi:hypothetical protein